MNRKMKLRYRVVLSLILSAVLFCMPIVAFSMNGNNVIDAKAEESGTEEETGNATKENTTGQETESSVDENPKEQEMDGNTESEMESGTEVETEGESFSGN